MKLHTLVLMVGPSNSGKSQMANEVLKPAAKAAGLQCAVISSDEIRQELLGAEHAKRDCLMAEVSKAAFDVLEAKARAHMSYPVNTELVIVDTTGINEAFRVSMNAMAKELGYHTTLMVFNLDKKELQKNIDNQVRRDKHEGNASKEVTFRQLTRLRENVMPKLDRKAYTDVVVFQKPEHIEQYIAKSRSPEFFEELATYNRAQLLVQSHVPVSVIGDVHECASALKELVSNLPEGPLVFVGDLIDTKVLQGEQPTSDSAEAVLDYVLELAKQRDVRIVAGNHERFVYRRVRKEISAQPELEKTFFTSVKPMMENEQLFAKLDAVMKMSTPFVKIAGLGDYYGNRKTAYVTHAPVVLKHVGKLSAEAVKAQANLYFAERDEDSQRKELEFVAAQSDTNYPFHIFGHVAIDGRARIQKSSIWLDTGAVMGGELSAAVLQGQEVHIRSVKTDSQYPVKPRLRLSTAKNKSNLDFIVQTDYELDDDSLRTVQAVLAGKAQFISGTMPPAPSRGSDIESLQACLEHFAKQGVDKLVLEPKYMGSRCQAYLKRNAPGESFLVSRNGFEIKHFDSTAVIEKLLNQFADFEYSQELVLDGELLPWHALGKGLIEYDFKDYGRAIAYQLENLKDDAEFAKLQIAAKVDVPNKQTMLALFEKQLALYGQESEARFQPFSILRVDGQSWMHKDQAEIFGQVANAPCVVVNPQEQGSLEQAQAFFDLLTTEQGMEGIVAKPAVVDLEKGQTPYMKVRNKDYLTLVYGFDYKNRMQRLADSKKIGGKLQLANLEYRLGKLMLEHPEHREKLVYAMFGSIAKEKSLDPRL